MVHLDDMKQEASFVLLEECIYANTIIPKLNKIFNRKKNLTETNMAQSFWYPQYTKEIKCDKIKEV